MEKVENKKREEKAKVGAANGLNLRQEPNGKIIDILPLGNTVKVVSDRGEWTEVKVGKQSGWVMSQYLRKE